MRIFVRQRRRAGPGTGQPQFAVVAVEGGDLRFYRRSLRKSELSALAEALGAEVVLLPSGTGEGEGKGKGRDKDQPHPRHRDGRRRRDELLIA
ncbi:MAG: hypothetical protein JW981_07090 [Anaerolineae bacterium]|nr:hypothetical protein [Anaerolineae bacterium]